MSEEKGVPQSLFKGAKVSGAEVCFRAVCAVGWVVSKYQVDLWSVSEGYKMDLQHWIDTISKKVLEDYGCSKDEAQHWLAEMQNQLMNIAKGPDARAHRRLAEVATQMATAIVSPEASNIVAQLDEFNNAGFALAQEFVSSPQWATDHVRERWRGCKRFGVRLAQKEAPNFNFKPVTCAASASIVLQVAKTSFDTKNALLSYLTLPYQFMHEYISHVLPVWKSVGMLLEDGFLLAVMQMYYRNRRQGSLVGVPSLVFKLNERRGATDEYYPVRETIRENLASVFGGDSQMSRLVLELAVSPPVEFTDHTKDQMLTHLRKLPVPHYVSTSQAWAREDLRDLQAHLSRVFPEAIKTPPSSS